jgi:hypothetical protein
VKIKFDVARPEFVSAPHRVADAEARHARATVATTRQVSPRAHIRATPGAHPRDPGQFGPGMTGTDHFLLFGL